jgi:hypothetical protein
VDRIDIAKDIQVEASDVIAILTDKIADLIAQNAVLTAQVRGLLKLLQKPQ